MVSFSIYIHFTVLLTKYFNVEYSMLQFLMPKQVIICLLSCLKLFCNHYFCINLTSIFCQIEVLL